MKILITSTPMLGMIGELRPFFDDKEVVIHCPEVVQAMKEEELISIIPEYDGWIIGDDPATYQVLEAGVHGNLKAAVKWGVGVDNVDFEAAEKLSIPIENTPDMFGNEVGDIVMSYITTLARKTFLIDREVKAGMWPKPRGISLADKVVGLVGFGNTGQAIAKRAYAADMHLIVYTRHPDNQTPAHLSSIEFSSWPNRVEECDFIVLACSLNPSNWHMINEGILNQVKKGVRIVNTARGNLIEEAALVDALRTGVVQSVALDVYEKEPLPMDSQLRRFEQCILGSHNASNTVDAVLRTSKIAIQKIFKLLEI
ncbi:MAG: NAD(P)-dependent oxidoreductase [Candidatus Thiodiazotropha sp.]